MTVLDWIFAAIVGVFCGIGFRRGLIGELFRVAAVFVGLFGGFVYSTPLADLLSRHLTSISIKGLRVFSFIVMFVVFAGAITAVGFAAKKVIRLTILGWIDRLGGVLAGALKGLLIVGFFVWIISFLPSLQSGLELESTKLVKHATKSIAFLWDLAQFRTKRESEEWDQWKEELAGQGEKLDRIKEFSEKINDIFKDSAAKIVDSFAVDSAQGDSSLTALESKPPDTTVAVADSTDSLAVPDTGQIADSLVRVDTGQAETDSTTPKKTEPGQASESP